MPKKILFQSPSKSIEIVVEGPQSKINADLSNIQDLTTKPQEINNGGQTKGVIFGPEVVQIAEENISKQKPKEIDDNHIRKVQFDTNKARTTQNASSTTELEEEVVKVDDLNVTKSAEDKDSKVLSTTEIYVKVTRSNGMDIVQSFEVPIYEKPLKEDSICEIYSLGVKEDRENSDPHLAFVELVEKDSGTISEFTVDENFLDSLSSIIQTPDPAERKKQLDQLLKAIDDYKPERKKSGSCPLFKKKKPNKNSKKIKLKPKNPTKHAKKASDPYFDHSFYRYKVKSRQEELTFEPNRKYMYGEKGSGFQSKGEPQDFYKLRDECLQRGTLFEDPEFPPTDSSLFFSHRPDRNFEWKRPQEISDNAQFFVEGFSRFDVQQGELGDCWLLAAVANLTLYRRLFFQIVPDDQSFDENYAGIFHFRFWQYGRWIDVVIDDRLPTYRGELVFLHSTEENEFWSALLEKAYAKLHGSYEALKGGSTCEAMEDFTGGVTEMYEMDSPPPNLFKIILKAYERWSLMGCSIEPDPNVLEAQTPEGLVRGHAYSITKVQYVNINTPRMSGKIPLLRLRNPWGNESEWNGAWSDHSPEWQYISDEDKEELGLNFDADGEFWMSFKDFQTHFNRLEICNLNPDSLSEDELTEGRNKKWVMSTFEGEWVRGVTAGGCRNFIDTFWHNPQYRVTLEEVDEGDDEDKCTLIVALMQKNRRLIRNTGGDLLTIGFAIYYLPHPDRAPKPLDLNFFKYNASVARSPSFINLREVSCRFKLPRGTYCIVPSTFDPNEEGEFLLRVFSEHQNNMEYDGFNSANLRSNEVGDSDEDRRPHYPSNPSYPSAPSSHYPDTPSSPYPSGPSNPYPNTPSSPYPGTPGGGYPYPNNPYQSPYSPQSPNPYPQTPYGQYPYPNNPQQPYPPQYPQYPPPPPPDRDSSRGSRGSDPIMNFFNKLFR